VQFTQLPKFKKPRKKASKEEWDSYWQLTKAHNASTEFVKQLRYLRNELDLAGLHERPLLAVVDASYVNQTCLLSDIKNTSIVGRTRRNCRLHFRAASAGRRFYSTESFTAEELRKNDSFPYKSILAHYAGEYRQIKYKEFTEVFWKWSTRKKPLRLIIISPTPYRRTLKSKLEYRDPAYLLTTNFDLSAGILIQKYLDRWQIEVNFQEEKQQMALGKQQVWSSRSIPRAPAFIVACYAALVLAGILHFSEGRLSSELEPLPKWRNKEPNRVTFSDLLTELRRELLEKVEFAMDGPRLHFDKSTIISTAAA
jgi:hypothetical protein